MSDMQKKQVHTDERGLMNDPAELRDMVHTITTTVHQVLQNPGVRTAVGEEIYRGLSTMMSSAHALVCPAARADMFLNLLAALVAEEEDDDPETEEIPTLKEIDAEWLQKLTKDL